MKKRLSLYLFFVFLVTSIHSQNTVGQISFTKNNEQVYNIKGHSIYSQVFFGSISKIYSLSAKNSLSTHVKPRL